MRSGSSRKDFRRRDSRGSGELLSLIAVLVASAVCRWTSQNILSTRDLEFIVFKFVSARLTNLKQYYEKKHVTDNKAYDQELLSELEIQHGLASGTLTWRYFDRIEKQAHTQVGTPQDVINSLTVRKQFRQAEKLAVTLATEEEQKLLPDNRLGFVTYTILPDGWPSAKTAT